MIGTVRSKASVRAYLAAKTADYKQLVKFRLNLMVIMSTAFGFGIAGGSVLTAEFALLLIGGFFTVGAANAINQIIERDSDRLMKRTENRPIVQGRISVTEATLVSLLLGLAGVLMLGQLNHLTAVVSFTSLIIYAFMYTPMKRISPVAVFIGAIPGALPPLLGYVAVTNGLDATAGFLFLIQFIWQFPHFYSIAWVLDDDYKRAGLRLLPVGSGRDKGGALQIVLFTALLVPAAVVPQLAGVTGLLFTTLGVLAGLFITHRSIGLLKSLSDRSAKQLMFASFIYLPVILIAWLIDRAFPLTF